MLGPQFGFGVDPNSCVAALGTDLTLPHVQVIPHNENHFDVFSSEFLLHNFVVLLVLHLF